MGLVVDCFCGEICLPKVEHSKFEGHMMPNKDDIKHLST